MKSKILLIVLPLFLLYCTSENREKKIMAVGKELLNLDPPSIRSTHNIVFVGEGLKQKIKEIKRQNPNINFQIKSRDLSYPYGDYRADYILILNNRIQKVDVRLKYNPNKNKFDILGFKTE